MKYLLIILKEISIQFLWGFIFGTIILIISWLRGYEDIAELSNILFIAAGILLIFVPIIFSPKGLNFPPDRRAPIAVIVEPSDDISLFGLSEQEQKKHLSLEEYIILIKFFGIGIAMILYSLIFYFLVGGS